MGELRNLRDIDLVVIHCAATPNGRWHTAADIDTWHAQRGFRRDPTIAPAWNPKLKAIGYHYVIYTTGAVVTGRALEESGAHAKGHNWRSIGCCLIGTDKFTRAQWDSLRDWLTCQATKLAVARGRTLPRDVKPGRRTSPAHAMDLFKLMDITVCGHRDLPDVHKLCPGFSVADWLKGDMAPLAGHLLDLPATQPPSAGGERP